VRWLDGQWLGWDGVEVVAGRVQMRAGMCLQAKRLWRSPCILPLP